jgi:hypothetical protein
MLVAMRHAGMAIQEAEKEKNAAATKGDNIEMVTEHDGVL